MYAKLFVLVVFATVVGSLLLIMRQQRVDAMHEMAMLHRQINHHRHGLWQWQTKIADATDPPTLQEALVRAGLELEPITPLHRPIAVAKASP